MVHRYVSSFLLLLLICAGSMAQPKHEVRAAWLTTAYWLDWPHTKAVDKQSIHTQKEELLHILDALKEAHFNTVLLQTRIRGDVIYPSNIEPWSDVLTGKCGKEPGYDPLAFAIEECHKRGMECHAWVVAFPLGNRRHVTSLGAQSVVRKKRNICVTYKNEYYLNPGHPATKEYLMQLIEEIVRRYDIDGIHLDYIRYPERATAFPDKKEFRQYAKGRSLETWRRENITETVRYIYRGVKRLKAWVKVSSSPVGKYRDTSRYPSKGWNAFHTVCQDPQEWMAQGIQDQIYPMLYFRYNDFYPFVLDWQEQSHGRQVIAGLGIYFLQTDEAGKADEWETNDIRRQVYFLRRHRLAGAGYYRAHYLENDTKGVTSMLKEEFYTQPALVPPVTWIDSIPPTAPQNLHVKKSGNGYTRLTWEAAQDVESDVTYVVYASDTWPVDTSKAAHIIAQGVRETSYIYAPIMIWEAKKYFAVTATDRCGNESTPASSPQ